MPDREVISKFVAGVDDRVGGNSRAFAEGCRQTASLMALRWNANGAKVLNQALFTKNDVVVDDAIAFQLRFCLMSFNRLTASVQKLPASFMRRT
jgi:hypothetical protein